MLQTLTIQNIVLIETLEISVDKGFTALTGETGAGKSILLDALGLVLGGKSDFTLIRQGSEQAFVAASFCLKNFEEDHPIFQLLQCHDILLDSSHDVLFKRTLNTAQKSKAYINDVPVSLSLLKQCGEMLLDIHGQHDHLLNEDLHKKIVDNFAEKSIDNFGALKEQCKIALENWQQAHDALTALDRQRQDYQDKYLFYETVLKDLNGLVIEKGTQEKLGEQKQSLQFMDKIISTVEDTLKKLESPASFSSILYGLQKNLEKIQDPHFPALANAALGLERCGIELNEVTHELKSLYDAQRSASSELEKIDEQLHILRTLARKYNCSCDDLYDLYQAAQNAIQINDDTEFKRQQLLKKVSEVLASFNSAKDALFNARLRASEELMEAVRTQLPDLKLEQADFAISLEDAKAQVKDPMQMSLHTMHKISFWVSMNAGQTKSPLAKSASGGEMTRLMLILKIIIAKTTKLPTLLFDEIDTGVGGAVAHAIGLKLKALSEHVQVLSITHSAQVAAKAHTQWKIYKVMSQGATTTHVRVLQDNERIEEIGRLLAGASLTQESRLAAQVLLQDR